MTSSLHLTPNQSPGAQVSQIEDGWRFTIPAETGGAYRLAQLDDYAGLPRRALPWQSPLTVSLRARVSGESLPGTWGFGLWNDPFGIGLGFGGSPLRLPCLPNAIWFFHATPPNHLSLRDDRPGEGFLAMSIRSPRWPTLALSPGLVLLPLLATRKSSRWLRRLASRVVQADSQRVGGDPTQWHAYRLEWRENGVRLSVDEVPLLESDISPIGPLGLVLWIDNQYAAWKPDGSLAWGIQSNEESWLEIQALKLEQE
jgi:hypothetical protein